MSRRLAAAIAGTVLIAAAVLAFSLGKHPVIAGTNSASPISPALVIQGGETKCQLISRVPANASHVRLAIASIAGPPGDLRIKVRGTTEPAPEFAGGRKVIPGGDVIKLKRPTKALHPAGLCMHYFGTGHIVLSGERKRVPPAFNTSAVVRRGSASVVFLRPGLTSWASRRDLIADRYANDQAGALGRWSLWLAVCAAIVAAGLALWWLVFRLGRDPQPQ